MVERESPRARPAAWRLAETTSTYLKEASEQDIEWYPWGPEAFELAKRTNRPVLLDIGAAWCHWCHVMDEGTYSDPEVARLLRQHFVTVKVDRDEHPEVDRRFQRQVNTLTGEGGWPLTAFVTPTGETFLGGTYFPARDGMGRPGFRRVLAEVARLWKDEPDKIRGSTESLRQALDRSRTAPTVATASLGTFVGSVRGEVHQSYDAVNGGFGFAPKFPHPTAISFLFWDAFTTGQPAAAERALSTLRRMADGGIYDHLGGGFHRYATDEGWHIPHFEKMAVDNAALLSAYVEGAQWSGEPRLVEVVRGTQGWLLDILGNPDGGFGASQDADNAPGDDGSYFTWSRPQLKSSLDPDELRLVTRFFGVGSEGRMPHDPDQNVLYRLMTVNEAAEGVSLTEEQANHVLERAMAKLRRTRSERPAPKVDRAEYASLNGSIIRALVRSGLFLGDAEPIAAARRAADRFLAQAYDPARGIAHRVSAEGGVGFGLLEDQAEFALGLLELSVATVEPKYIEVTNRLLDLVDQHYRDPSGLLRDLAPDLYDGPSIGTFVDVSFPVEDSPHLSANSAAVLAFERLHSITDEERWRWAAETTLGPLSVRLQRAGLFGAGGALAAGLLDTPPARVVVEGDPPLAEGLLRAARTSWYPMISVFRGEPPVPFSGISDAAAGSPSPGPRSAHALVCFGTRCLAPVNDPAELPSLIRSEGRPPAA
ncbi:MAG: thioredoxin domain-containing protein [Thermoplasmata archaeon]